MGYTIEPVEGESYEGRQWGYVVKRDGEPILRATTGGTGACWNIEEAVPTTVGADGEMEADEFHVCDLNEFIAALEALRDSEAHRLNVERWA